MKFLFGFLGHCGYTVFEHIAIMMDEHKEKGYITLKEASERFGYTPDYIGQLIRKGKIEGKQVYASVAWMTTEDAMREYIAGNAPSAPKQDSVGVLDRIMDTLFLKHTHLLTWVLRLIFAILIMTGLFVFYFLSITIDDHLAKQAEEALVARLEAQYALHSSAPITPFPPVAYGQ